MTRLWRSLLFASSVVLVLATLLVAPTEAAPPPPPPTQQIDCTEDGILIITGDVVQDHDV